MKFNFFRRDKDQATTAKRQFLEALRRRDINAINSLFIKWQKILGAKKLADVIVNRVMVECDADSHRWFVQRFLGQLKYEQMEEQAQNNVIKILLNAGLELGKDFSVGLDGEIIMSDRATQTLLDYLPQQQREFFAAQLQFFAVADPVIAIEEQLGCTFYTNLTEVASQRVQLLNNSQAAAYLGVLIAGLVKRHPQLKDVDFPTIFIFNTLQDLPQQRVTAILNDEETNPQFDEIIIFQDLLTALGTPDSQCIAEDEGSTNLKYYKKLDLVWCSERRISEIVAMMQDWHQRHKAERH